MISCSKMDDNGDGKANVLPSLSNNNNSTSKQQVRTFVLHVIHSGQVLNHKYGNRQNTLLHLAVLHDLQDCVEKLLSAGANPLEKNGDSQTPSDIAVDNGHQVILQMLNRREEYRKHLQMGDTSDRHLDADTTHEVDSYRESIVDRQSLMSSSSSRLLEDSINASPKSFKPLRPVEDHTKITPMVLGAVYEDYCDWTISTRCFHLKELIDQLKNTEKKLHQELKSLGICKGNSFKNLIVLQKKIRNKEHKICMKLWDTIKAHRENKRVLDLISTDSSKFKSMLGQIENTVYWFGDVQVKGHKSFIFEKWRNAKLCVTGQLIYIHVLGNKETPESVSLDHIISLCSGSRQTTRSREPFISLSSGPIRRKLRSKKNRQIKISNVVLKKHCAMYSLEHLIKLTIIKNSSQHKLEKELIFHFHDEENPSTSDNQNDLRHGRSSTIGADEVNGAKKHNSASRKGCSWTIHLRLLDNNKRSCDMHPRSSDCSTYGGNYGTSFINTADNVAHVIKILRDESVEIMCQLDGRSYPYTVRVHDFLHDPDNDDNRFVSPLEYLLSQSSSRRRRCFSSDDTSLVENSERHNRCDTNHSKLQKKGKEFEASTALYSAFSTVTSSSMSGLTSSFRTSSSKSSSVNLGSSMSISSAATSVESLATIASAIHGKRIPLVGILEEETSDNESLEFEHVCEDDPSELGRNPTQKNVDMLPPIININATISEEQSFCAHSPCSASGFDLQIRHSMSMVDTTSPSNLTMELLNCNVDTKEKLIMIAHQSFDDSILCCKGLRHKLETTGNKCRRESADDKLLGYSTPWIHDEMVYDINYIPYLRDLLNTARSTSYIINVRLCDYISKREKLLEHLHYLQSLRSVVETPPLAPTRCLIAEQSPLMDKFMTMLTVYRDHVDKLTQQDEVPVPLPTVSVSSGLSMSSAPLLSRSPIFKTNYMESLQADFVGRNPSFSSYGSTVQTSSLFGNHVYNQPKSTIVLEATEFVHSMIGEQNINTYYPEVNFGRTSSISTLMSAKQFSRYHGGTSFSYGASFNNWDYSDDASASTVELQSELNRISPWKTARNRRTSPHGNHVSDYDGIMDGSKTKQSFGNHGLPNFSRESVQSATLSKSSIQSPKDPSNSNKVDVNSKCNFRHFLGAPPNQYRQEYEEAMKNIEQIWNCELESFETAEKLAQCLVQRERTWRYLCTLRDKEFSYSQAKLSQPTVELYDIEI